MKSENFIEGLATLATAATHTAATQPEPKEPDQILVACLKAGRPVRVEMGGIGQAYWVGTADQCKHLQEELLAKGDPTPVFAWGELVLIKDLSLEDKRNVYELKRWFRGAVQDVVPHAD